jgi:hypothetical protein
MEVTGPRRPSTFCSIRGKAAIFTSSSEKLVGKHFPKVKKLCAAAVFSNDPQRFATSHYALRRDLCRSVLLRKAWADMRKGALVALASVL